MKLNQNPTLSTKCYIWKFLKFREKVEGKENFPGKNFENLDIHRPVVLFFGNFGKCSAVPIATGSYPKFKPDVLVEKKASGVSAIFFFPSSFTNNFTWRGSRLGTRWCRYCFIFTATRQRSAGLFKSNWLLYLLWHQRTWWDQGDSRRQRGKCRSPW